MYFLRRMLFIPVPVLLCAPASAQLDKQYQQQQNLNRDVQAAKENLCRQISDNAQFKANDSLGRPILWLVDARNNLFTIGPDPNKLSPFATDCYFSGVLGKERWVNAINQSCNPNQKISLGNYGGNAGVALVAGLAQVCSLQKYVIENDSLVRYSMLSKSHGGNGSVNRSVVGTRFR